MKILFCIGDFALGGAQRRLSQLLMNLNGTGDYELSCLLLTDVFDYPEVKKLNINFYVLNREKSRKDTFRDLYTILSKEKPDIVHCWSLRLAFYLNFFKPIFNFKYLLGTIVSCRQLPLFSKMGANERFSFWLADLIISNSYAGLKAKNAPLRKSTVVYNGFNNSRLAKITDSLVFREELGITTDFVVSMIARLHEDKDVFMFLDVAEALKKRTDITFLLIGKGPLEEQCIQYINKNKISNVRLLGFRSDVEDIINITDISLLCSRPDTIPEGISNSILESMAFGVPVIATSGGGTNEIVQDGKTGYLVQSKNVGEMATKITTLLDNPEKRYKFSQNSKKLVEEKFSMPEMVFKYKKIYNNLK